MPVSAVNAASAVVERRVLGRERVVGDERDRVGSVARPSSPHATTGRRASDGRRRRRGEVVHVGVSGDDDGDDSGRDRHGDAAGRRASLLTPRPTSGSRSWSTSGQRAPSTVTPRHGPCIASTENVVPRARSSSTLPGPWTTCSRSPPHHASSVADAGERRGAERAERGDGVVEPVAGAGQQQDAVAGRSDAAWAMASSVSVSPCRRVPHRPRRARSPTPAPPATPSRGRRSAPPASSPAAKAWSSPPSAAMSVAPAGTARDGAPVERGGSGDHDDRLGHMDSSAGITRIRFSGRRRRPPSQPTEPVSSPCWSATTLAGAALATRT